ncbi:lipoprotein [Spiroplasma endosymbiont of Seladonia tumulorum]|uniref:lipoprotein n=1 Tax=Spiroplasma endosymbiont of Seladonia tumulorum TaxID=3066321 RepID=UPI0030CFBE90
MKKLLSIISTISLVGTSTTSLVACNTQQEYTPEELAKEKEKNKITTKDGILEWIVPKEKPFKEIGNNKYYFIIWKGLKLDKWTLKKYKDVGLDRTNSLIDKSYSNAELHRVSNDLHTIANKEYSSWNKDDETYFKSIYRWNGEEQKLPDLIIDNDGNVKVNGE